MYSMRGCAHVMRAKDRGAVLEGIHLQRLRGRDTGVRREAKRFKNHRFTADTD